MFISLTIQIAGESNFFHQKESIIVKNDIGNTKKFSTFPTVQILSHIFRHNKYELKWKILRIKILKLYTLFQAISCSKCIQNFLILLCDCSFMHSKFIPMHCLLSDNLKFVETVFVGHCLWWPNQNRNLAFILVCVIGWGNMKWEMMRKLC